VNAIDFLDREIHVGDMIVYPAGGASSSVHMVKGEVLEVRAGTNRWGRPCPILRVRSLRDSRSNRHAPAARPINLTNVRRCVVVSGTL
jgi:hypothetical protein